MRRATSISVILVCCIIFSSNLIAQQQFPNSGFESWAGGTPAYWTEWGYLEDCVVPTGGYIGTGARLREVEHPNGWNYDMGMQLTEPAPITTEYNWFRFYYKAFFDVGGWVDMALKFYDQNGSTVAAVYETFFWEDNTNDWILEEFELNFSGIPSTGTLKFDGQGNGYDGWGSYFDIDELMLIEAIDITEPQEGDKWIAGQTDTIRWIEGMEDLDIILQYSTNDGANWVDIVELPSVTGKYGWDIPADLLSNEAAIRIAHEVYGIYEVHDDVDIKIKPYVITKLNAQEHYVAYDINTDRWGFGNYPNDMWPVWWWLQFNYQLAIDPFTESTYSQLQGGGIFKNVHARVFPDWISFVNTFSVDTCYWSTTLGIYSPTALTKWNSIMKIWGGSCFGIAASNALAFEKKAEFRNKYPNFPAFVFPINVTSNENVIPVISELHTHIRKSNKTAKE